MARISNAALKQENTYSWRGVPVMRRAAYTCFEGSLRPNNMPHIILLQCGIFLQLRKHDHIIKHIYIYTKIIHFFETYRRSKSVLFICTFMYELILLKLKVHRVVNWLILCHILSYELDILS